jgi:hypothetical protein
MTAKEFETSLRELLNRKPFLPFEVEYTDGRRFWVDIPSVAFARGGATFLGQDVIHMFDYTNVNRFIPVSLTEARP